MHRTMKTCAVAALTVTSFGGFASCDNSDEIAAAFSAQQRATLNPSGPNNTVSACDGIRRHIRQDALKQFGFDLMIEQMKRISREVSSDEREDLRRFSLAIDSPGVNPELRTQSIQLVQGIYAGAIDRVGLHRGVGEHHEEIHRSIMLDPSGVAPLFDGYTLVQYSSPLSTTQPAVGAITDAYLGVTADQAHYEPILMKVKTSTTSANGFSVTGDYITMSQYVESNLPSYCANAGTALPAGQLNIL